ncbi:hypothetical protein STEG23_034102, partial [Scotinomys teguina]
MILLNTMFDFTTVLRSILVDNQSLKQEEITDVAGAKKCGFQNLWKARGNKNEKGLVMEVISSANVFKSASNFLFYQVQSNWIYVEVFDPLGIKFCA